jgi:hypothetical protein
MRKWKRETMRALRLRGRFSHLAIQSGPVDLPILTLPGEIKSAGSGKAQEACENGRHAHQTLVFPMQTQPPNAGRG